MYKLIIENENLSTELQVMDFKGVMMLIKTFTKRYGEPQYTMIVESNCNEEVVRSINQKELIK